jgi:predicted permease
LMKTARDGALLLDPMLRDLRYAARSLRRDLGATVFSIAIAGLGIGASTTVFGLCQALLLRPLPFREPERLVWIANGTSENLSAQTVQVSNFQSLVEQNRSFDGVAGFNAFYGPGDIRLGGSGDPERITGVPVTQSFFPLLGVSALYGRFFDDAESRFGGPRAAVLDHRFFVRRFGGDPRIVGQSIVLDGEPVTVIGVLPASFDFEGTFSPGRPADLFLAFPLALETDRRGNLLALIGRLENGVRIDAAQAEATAIAASVPRSRMDGQPRNRFTPTLSPLRDRVSGRFRTALLALAGAVGFLMLLVCANLSNLLLVRASARRREMAVRSALGARPSQLIRQALIESLVLGAGGAMLGLAIAVVATASVSRLQGTVIPLLREVRVDGVVFAFTAVIAIVTSIVFGLLPALQTMAVDVRETLAEESRGSTGRRSGWLRRAVVVAELALACVLLTGAGLLTRSLSRVLDVEPGYATENVIALRVDQPQAKRTGAERRAYLDELVRTVSAVPGVAAVGLTDALPLGDNYGWRRWSARAAEQPNDSIQRPGPLVRMVDAGYFTTMGIPLRSGSAFSTSDVPGSEPVAIVNETLASALWPGRDPIGRMMVAGGTPRRVIGVVGSVRYFSLDRDVEREMYFPIGHSGGYTSVDLVVRASTSSTAGLIASVRAALRRADPDLPVANFRTMEDLVDRSVFARRFVVLLVAGFAMFGVMLSALGVYAVISYSVSQRAQEIGIRMALGATADGVRRGILAETGRLAVVGLALGLPLSWMAARAIRGLLYDVGSFDAVTFAATLVALVVVAACGGYLPARRATRVDPALALRPR